MIVETKKSVHSLIFFWLPSPLFFLFHFIFFTEGKKNGIYCKSAKMRRFFHRRICFSVSQFGSNRWCSVVPQNGAEVIALINESDDRGAVLAALDHLGETVPWGILDPSELEQVLGCAVIRKPTLIATVRTYLDNAHSLDHDIILHRVSLSCTVLTTYILAQRGEPILCYEVISLITSLFCTANGANVAQIVSFLEFLLLTNGVIEETVLEVVLTALRGVVVRGGIPTPEILRELCWCLTRGRVDFGGENEAILRILVRWAERSIEKMFPADLFALLYAVEEYARRDCKEFKKSAAYAHLMSRSAELCNAPRFTSYLAANPLAETDATITKIFRMQRTVRPAIKKGISVCRQDFQKFGLFEDVQILDVVTQMNLFGVQMKKCESLKNSRDAIQSIEAALTELFVAIFGSKSEHFAHLCREGRHNRTPKKIRQRTLLEYSPFYEGLEKFVTTPFCDAISHLLPIPLLGADPLRPPSRRFFLRPEHQRRKFYHKYPEGASADNVPHARQIHNLQLGECVVRIAEMIVAVNNRRLLPFAVKRTYVEIWVDAVCMEAKGAGAKLFFCAADGESFVSIVSRLNCRISAEAILQMIEYTDQLSEVFDIGHYCANVIEMVLFARNVSSGFYEKIAGFLDSATLIDECKVEGELKGEKRRSFTSADWLRTLLMFEHCRRELPEDSSRVLLGTQLYSIVANNVAKRDYFEGKTEFLTSLCYCAPDHPSVTHIIAFIIEELQNGRFASHTTQHLFYNKLSTSHAHYPWAKSLAETAILFTRASPMDTPERIKKFCQTFHIILSVMSQYHTEAFVSVLFEATEARRLYRTKLATAVREAPPSSFMFVQLNEATFLTFLRLLSDAHLHERGSWETDFAAFVEAAGLVEEGGGAEGLIASTTAGAVVQQIPLLFAKAATRLSGMQFTKAALHEVFSVLRYEACTTALPLQCRRLLLARGREVEGCDPS